MPAFIGHYNLDLDASAKLHVGYFQDRFEMTPGYEKAMQDFMQSRAAEMKTLNLTLDSQHLVIREPGKIQQYDVKSLVEDGAKPQLTLGLGKFTMTYDLIELEPGLIHFANRHYDLHGWAWRRVADRAPDDVIAAALADLAKPPARSTKDRKKMPTETYLAELAERSGLTEEQIRRFVQAQAELAYIHGPSDNGYPIPGIGVVHVVQTAPTSMVMPFGPNKGRVTSIPAKKRLTFRYADAAKESLFGRDVATAPDVFTINWFAEH